MRRTIFGLGLMLAGGCLNDDGDLGADGRDAGTASGGSSGASGGSSGTGSSGAGSGGGGGSSNDAGGGSAGIAGSAGSVGSPGDAGNAGDAGESCNPEGTWSLVYDGECFIGKEGAFVTRTGPGPNDLRVRFPHRSPLPEGCAETDEPLYTTSVAFDPVACTLVLAYDASRCASGAPQCLPTQERLIKVEAHLNLRDMSQSWAGTTRCPPFGQTEPSASACSARYSRRTTEASACKDVIHNTPCPAGAVCDSGCGTPCLCANGLWSCEFPKAGQACTEGEACGLRVGQEGGYEGLSCMTPSGGQPQLIQVETQRFNSVCPAAQPAPGSPCNLYPRGLSCGNCVCEARNASLDEWRCGG